MHDEPQFQNLKRIFEAALSRIDPYGMLKDRMRLVGSRLDLKSGEVSHTQGLLCRAIPNLRMLLDNLVGCGVCNC